MKCPTTNPIEYDEKVTKMDVTFTPFVIFEPVPEAIYKPILDNNTPIKLTGNRSWYYAGVGYAYEVDFDGQTYWVKSQSIKVRK